MKIYFRCFLILSFFLPPLYSVYSGLPKTPIITGSCRGLAREQAGRKVSLAISCITERDIVDKMIIRLPDLPRDLNLQCTSNSNLNIRGDRKEIIAIRGRTGLTETNPAPVSTWSTEFGFSCDFTSKNTGDILKNMTRQPIQYRGYSSNRRVSNGTFNVEPIPNTPWDSGRIYSPGQISPGSRFVVSVDDELERKIMSNLTEDFPEEEANGELRESLTLGENTGYPALKMTFGQNLDSGGLNWKPMQRYFPDNVPIDFSQNPIFVGTVPENINPGYKIRVSYTDRFREKMYENFLDDVRIIPKPETSCTFSVSECSKYAFAGQTFCACGCFDTQDLAFGYIAGLSIDGRPVYPLASSGTTATLFVPAGLTPGEHTLTYTPKNGIPTSVKFIVLKVNGTIDQNKLKTGEATDLRLQILGTDEKLPIELTNRTPAVVTVDGGVVQTIDSSGGANNMINRGVKGTQQGNFNITYKLSVPPCPCNN